MNNKIKVEAKKRYPSEQLGTKGMIDSGRRKIFSEGAEWMCSEIFKYIQRWTDDIKEHRDVDTDVLYLVDELKQYFIDNDTNDRQY